MTEVPARPQARGFKQPQDTAAGCRSRAEADLLASATVVTANARIRLETSAASWNARATMLQRLDDNHAALKAKVARDAGRGNEASPVRL